MAKQELRRTRHPGIYLTETGRYRVIVANKKKTAETLTDAKLLAAEMRTAISKGAFVSTKHTVASYYDLWLPTLQQRKSSQRRYRSAMVNHVLPALGNVKLIDLRASHIRRLRDELSTKLERVTVISTLAPLSIMLSAACEDDILVANVAKNVKAPPNTSADEETIRALNEDELRRFFEHVDPEHEFFFRFLLNTALRISEVLAIRWQDWEGDRIHVRRRYYEGTFDLPKSGKTRVVRISNNLQAALTCRRLETGGTPEGLIFPNTVGNPWDDTRLGVHTLRPAAEAARLGKVTFHTFRHTAATRWYRAGVPLGLISEMLGHATPAFTWRTYVTVFEADLPNMDWQDALDPSNPNPVPEEVPA